MKKLSLFFATVLFAGSLMATTVTKTVEDMAVANSWENATVVTPFQLDKAIYVSTEASDANTGKYYDNGRQIRLYQTGSAKLIITAAEGCTISSITLTYASQNTGTLLEAESGVAVNFDNVQSATFTVGNTGSATNGQVRITEFSVTYEGDPGDDPGVEPGELTYDYEPSTPTQIEGELTYGEFINYLEEGVIELYFESDDYVVSLLAFSNSWSTVGGIVNGNWDINDSQEDGTILASPGGDEEADYPSFVGADIDDEGYYNTSYYLASGYVNVMPASDNPERDGVKFEINAVSHFGTTIKLTYTGIVEEVEIDDTAVENVEAKPQFDENAPMYNAAGQRVNKDFRGVIIQKGGKFMLSK
ncbi:MAG: hypothetical protein IJS05_00375 [Paludibacteraceae bacterium]|nr:hypothetical protein [Paludibacteraceae bacterium]